MSDAALPPAADPQASDAPPLPRHLQVEVTGSCNLSCRMCLVSYRTRLSRREASLDPAAFRQLLDELPEITEVTLQGLGEPLLAPGLEEMIREAAGRGIDVGFNTNGMLLTPAWSERLVAAGLAWLHVSLDGATQETLGHIRRGARLDRIVDNVRGLVDARRRAGASRPRIQLNVVAMRANQAELADLVDLAADLGVDRLWMQTLSHDFDDVAEDGRYVKIRAFAQQQGAGATDRPMLDALAGAAARADRRGLDLRLPGRHDGETRRAPGTPGCDWPWRSAYVNHDGRVQPCCMLMGAERATMGRLDGPTDGEATTGGFAEIWHNEAYRSFRRALLSEEPPAPCRGCSEYRGTF